MPCSSRRREQNELRSPSLARGLLIWTAALIATVVAVLFSFVWLDRPIALLVDHHQSRVSTGLLDWMAVHIANPLIPLAELTLLGVAMRTIALRVLPRGHYAAAFAGSLSVLISEVVKRVLQILFGRPGPETWINNNSSFISNGSYGFHFLHGGFASFPSGHMATACALIVVLWIWYPRWRWLYVTAASAIGSILVGANFHFLSDVVAGAFVGTSVGLAVTAICSRVTSLEQVSFR